MSNIKKSLQNLDFALNSTLSSVRSSFATVNSTVQMWIDFTQDLEKFLVDTEAETKGLREKIANLKKQVQELEGKAEKEKK